MWDAWGVTWGDSWGSSWGPLHEVDDLRRPRTNFRLQAIREGRGQLVGEESRTFVGEVRARGATPEVTACVSGIVRLSGVEAATQCGIARSRASARVALHGTAVRAVTAQPCGRSGARARVTSSCARLSLGRVSTWGAAEVNACDSEVETFVGELSGRGVLNPSDEELVILALRAAGILDKQPAYM